jgi:DinB superfamily
MEELFVTTVVTSWKQIVNRLDERFARLDDEQLQKQIAPNKNRLFYLLGHLTAVHDRMLPLLGIGKRLHPDLDEAYLTNPDQTFSDPLSAADLKKAWSEVNAAITSAVEKFSVDDWLKKHTAVSDEDFSKDPTRNRLAMPFIGDSGAREQNCTHPARQAITASASAISNVRFTDRPPTG